MVLQVWLRRTNSVKTGLKEGLDPQITLEIVCPMQAILSKAQRRRMSMKKMTLISLHSTNQW
jgi:hypothetical protein